MTAICTKGFLEYTPNGVIIFESGDLIDYVRKGSRFVFENIELPSEQFFNYFKVVEGNDKMSYSDFEWILCNRIFTMSVLFPEEYNGIRHLIIQNLYNAILITINREETVIRVSFDDTQEKYASYEDALDGIKNHKSEV